MIRKIQTLVLAAVVTATFFACTDKTCDRESNLFLYGEGFKEIPFDSLASIEKTLSYLEYTYCVQRDSAIPVIYFNTRRGKITSKKRSSLPIAIEPMPCFSGYEYDFDQILEIFLDGNNILIEEKRMPLDSIARFIEYQYLNFGTQSGFSRDSRYNGIWLITEKARPVSDLEPIIAEVIRGYRLAFEMYSNSLFQKSICDMDSIEWAIMSDRMQFRLALKYSDKVE